MKKLFLLVIVLFLSFQQVTLAAIGEAANTPDSVFLFSYATSRDDGRSGLRFAWSMDQKHWFAVGQGTGYLRCDYSRWGSQKKMLDPFLKQLPDGGWLCTWKLNTHDGYGQAKSKDLVYWESQKYPQVTSDFEGTRVKVTIDGQEQTGNINRVSWTLVDKLTKHYERNQYRNVLHAERPVQDKERFAGLKPVKATITVQPEETKEISNLLLGIFFEDINYSADGGLYAELIQNRDFEYDPSDREGDKNWNSTHSWKLEGDNATFTINTSDPVHPNNPHYAVLNIQQPGAVLTNAGFDGIALQAGEKYDFSLFGRIPAGHKSNKLQVRLIDSNGTVQGEASITVSSRSWKTYKTVLTAKTAADTHLELQLQSVGEVELDMISLFPQNTFKGRKNGLRAESGHPKPFNLKYIGIGNEDLITDIFEERFTMIFNAIKEKYPEIIVVGTVGPFNEGTDYVEGWKLADKLGIPMVDEHYYQSPGWFLHNQDFYDKYDRSKKTKVYLGEYATHIPGRKANMETALTEALYLTALERNGDVVHMTSYAPLLAKEKHTQWSPDLIYFNNREVKPTTGYYVQKLYGQNAGSHYIPSQIILDNQDNRVKLRIGSSIVRDSKTGDVIVKLVNLLPVSVETEIQLPGIGSVQPSAVRTVLAGAPESTPLPVTDTIEVGANFKQQLPAYSFTVIRLKTK